MAPSVKGWLLISLKNKTSVSADIIETPAKTGVWTDWQEVQVDPSIINSMGGGRLNFSFNNKHLHQLFFAEVKDFNSYSGLYTRAKIRRPKKGVFGKLLASKAHSPRSIYSMYLKEESFKNIFFPGYFLDNYICNSLIINSVIRNVVCKDNYFKEVKITNTPTEHSIFSYNTLKFVQFYDLLMVNNAFDNCFFSGCTFRNNTIEKTIFRNSIFYGCSFQNSVIKDCRFDHCSFTSASDPFESAESVINTNFDNCLFT